MKLVLDAIVLLALAALAVAEARSEASETENGLRAFDEVAAVLTSPRCLNCHVPGESPLQGDENRPHTMNVRRGPDGRGTVAARCTNCHQPANTDAFHAPPGAPDWRLPPPATPMAWQGLATAEICRTLQDPARNGHRNLDQLVEHVTSDRIVNWAWEPGPGRKPPPLSHDQFVRRFVEWRDSGAPCGPASAAREEPR